MISERIKAALRETLAEIGADPRLARIERPADLSRGDYATNAALLAAKAAGRSAREIAEEIARKLGARGEPWLSRAEAAGPGFVNIFLSRSFFAESVREIAAAGESWGRNDSLAGRRVMVEYTQPNPFKEFHIGHLMSNAIGESLSRLIEFSGAEVKRANYQGDVGLHVAKAIWGARSGRGSVESAAALGKAYAAGAAAYERDPAAKSEIDELNRRLYARDPELLPLYERGREVSLAHFEKLYRILGTAFDFYFFESETGERGKRIVEENLGKVFERSDGAVVFRGEKEGLHTRVFLTKEGLPTYEAKDLGLAFLKRERWPSDLSVTVTASEQTEYFKVVLAALRAIDPALAGTIRHVPHGMMRLSTGKMSSRTGEIVSGESLLAEVAAAVRGRMTDEAVLDRERIAEDVAVGAVKYEILKQNTGRDIVFDPERSLSLEGDSGPYLAYSNARARTLLKKAPERPSAERPTESVIPLERLLFRFPEVAARAAKEYEPHHLATYLVELAGSFNGWYAKERIAGGKDSPYRLAVAEAFAATMGNGLWLLGIPAPEAM